MGRKLWAWAGLVTALAVAAGGAYIALGGRPPAGFGVVGAGPGGPIVIGLIHSQTGLMAISEKSLLDAELLAIDEINDRGGVGGRPVKGVVADGRSEPAVFGAQARRLIDSEKAVALFGGWTSESRKAILAVVEEKDNLLVFSANYEGMERSGNVLYTSGSANQTVVPAVRWCVDTLKARRFFVVGNEEIWSRCAAEIAKDAAKAAGAEVAGEAYLPMAGGDVAPTIGAIKAARPDLILNTMIGESCLPFYAGLRPSGLAADKLPVMGFGIAEDELRRFPAGDMAGHYAGCSYFQSVDRDESRDFVRKFRAKYGANRVASDAIVAAYNGVMLWAQAAAEAGTAEPGAVQKHLDRQSLDAPEGIITIDPDSRVVWRPFHVGRSRPDGQFDVVWSVTKPIRPVAFVGTRSRSQWREFVAGLQARWGGRWSASAGARAAASASP